MELLAADGMTLLVASLMGYPSPLSRIGSAADGIEEHIGCDKMGYGIRGPIPPPLIPDLSDEGKEEGSVHLGGVWWLEVGGKVVGGPAIPEQIYAMGTGHLFQGAPLPLPSI